jgi:hypothetical protein
MLDGRPQIGLIFAGSAVWLLFHSTQADRPLKAACLSSLCQAVYSPHTRSTLADERSDTPALHASDGQQQARGWGREAGAAGGSGAGGSGLLQLRRRGGQAADTEANEGIRSSAPTRGVWAERRCCWVLAGAAAVPQIPLWHHLGEGQRSPAAQGAPAQHPSSDDTQPRGGRSAAVSCRCRKHSVRRSVLRRTAPQPTCATASFVASATLAVPVSTERGLAVETAVVAPAVAVVPAQLPGVRALTVCVCVPGAQAKNRVMQRMPAARCARAVRPRVGLSVGAAGLRARGRACLGRLPAAASTPTLC